MKKISEMLQMKEILSSSMHIIENQAPTIPLLKGMFYY